MGLCDRAGEEKHGKGVCSISKHALHCLTVTITFFYCKLIYKTQIV